jgi:hypothetical protein
MTLAQFAIARVAADLERRADGLTVGEARLLAAVLAPAVARYEAREADAAESPAKSNRRRANGC